MELMKGSATAFLLKLLAAALSFIVAASITRTVDQEVAGLYFFGTAVVGILVSLGSLGLNNAVLKNAAIFYHEKNSMSLNAIVNKSILWATSASVLLVVLATIGFKYFGTQKLEIYVSLQPLLLAVPGLVIVALLAHAIQGIDRLVPSMVLGGAIQPLVFFAFILKVEPTTAAGLASCFTVSALLTCLISAIYWLGSVEFKLSFEFPSGALRTSAFSLLIFQVFQQFNLVIGQMFLGVWGTSEEVALFSVCLKTASLTSFVMFAVNRVAAPKFAALYAQGDTEGLKLAVTYSKRIMLVGLLPILSIFMVAPEPVLRLFGDDYASGVTLLRLLAIVQLLTVWVGSVSYLLIMTGEEKVHRNNVIISTIIACLVGIFFSKNNAMMGAILVSGLSTLTVSLLSGFAVYRKLKINVFKF